MNTSLAKKLSTPSLTPIMGYQGHQQKIKLLVNTAWLAAQTAMWNGIIFSSEEKQKAREHIRNYFLNANDLDQAYSHLIQRLLIARWYVLKESGRYVSIPSRWFDSSNEIGWKVTEPWFDLLLQRRAAEPLYKLPLKAFAEAILEMAEDPSAKNFHYWREYFIEHNCQGLLNLFLATIANMNYVVE